VDRKFWALRLRQQAALNVRRQFKLVPLAFLLNKLFSQTAGVDRQRRGAP